MTETMNFAAIQATAITACKTFLLCGGMFAVCVLLDTMSVAI